MSRLGRFLLVMLTLTGVVSGLVVLAVWERLGHPGPLVQAATVIIPKGSSVAQIGEQLAEARVIRSSALFRWSARVTGDDDRLRAGEYRFEAGINARDALALLAEGRTVVRRLTVPEGLTSGQIVAILEETEGLTGSVGAPPPEGTLLPETYHFSLGDSRAQLLERMASGMRRDIAALWPNRVQGLPLATPEEAVILASIVEKETSIPAERRRVAAVFVNRLRIGMRLQADPTVAYAVGRVEVLPLARPLTQVDLQAPSPYNTYLVDGLPPGPIGNPGRAAIEAVLDPADTEELYFVADGSGGHAFARTLDEHNVNVARWREVLNRRTAQRD
jgi:UPF0755 protein